MSKKNKITEKLFHNFAIVAFVACMVVWVRVQGVNMVLDIQDIISTNPMSATEFIMRLSYFH